MTITKEKLKLMLDLYTEKECQKIDGKTYISLNGATVDDFLSHIYSILWQLQDAKDMRYVKSFAYDTSKNKIQVDI
jgi:hypothetical protein